MRSEIIRVSLKILSKIKSMKSGIFSSAALNKKKNPAIAKPTEIYTKRGI
jgi:hypothetical protein